MCNHKPAWHCPWYHLNISQVLFMYFSLVVPLKTCSFSRIYFILESFRVTSLAYRRVLVVRFFLGLCGCLWAKNSMKCISAIHMAFTVCIVNPKSCLVHAANIVIPTSARLQYNERHLPHTFCMMYTFWFWSCTAAFQMLCYVTDMRSVFIGLTQLMRGKDKVRQLYC